MVNLSPPLARTACSLPRDSWSPQRDQTALYVDDRWRIETVGNVWEQENSCASPPPQTAASSPAHRRLRLSAGKDGLPAPFVQELTLQEHALGHEVHVFVPASESLPHRPPLDGIHYHPLPIDANGSPLETAQAFARAVESHLQDAGPPSICSIITSGRPAWRRPAGPSAHTVADFIGGDATQWNASHRSVAGHPRVRSSIARGVRCVLTPDGSASGPYRVGHGRRGDPPFPDGGPARQRMGMPARYGQVKGEIGVGPLDRLILYIGPLEHSAGVDLLVEALPAALTAPATYAWPSSAPAPCTAIWSRRRHQLGVAYLRHACWDIERDRKRSIVGPRRRGAGATVALPCAFRRRRHRSGTQGRPSVVTTHSGPAHLIRHDENGLISYDNPGSMVSGAGSPPRRSGSTERMGQNGKRSEGSMQSWSDVTRHYLELCANVSRN